MAVPKGSHFTEEHKRKISEALKGKPKSESHRIKCRENALKGAWTVTAARREGSRRAGLMRKGKKRPDLSELNRKRWASQEYRDWFKETVGPKISRISKGRPHSREHTEKVRLSNLATNRNNPACRELKSESARLQWEDPVIREKMIKGILRGLFVKPNKKETILLGILNSSFPEDWKYVGNGDLIIGGKCPDFVNVNGKKAIIELFGDYWHKGEDPQDRINVFNPYGYKTLVIWESELKNTDVVISKIKSTFYCSG